MPITISHNHSLREHNTFGMDVKARQFISYDSVEDLVEILATLRNNGEPMLHIGAGSNLLFTKDFNGTILHSNIKHMEVLSRDSREVLVRVGAGVIWDDFCTLMVQNNYYGSENLSLIPGEVGAAAVQNIGAYGVEVESIIHEVETTEIATGQPRVFPVSECEYGYRDSVFKNRLQGQYIVTAVIFKLATVPVVHLDYGPLQQLRSLATVPTACDIRNTVIAIRQSKLPDPAQLGSAGSFFKNPVVPIEIYHQLATTYAGVPHYAVSDQEVKIPAAWLIEQCGWKGRRHGGAAVYEKQPLILVNMGNAVPSDIIELAALIEQSVKEKFQIQLHPEVNYI